jgi:hypothetical protein
MHINTDSSASSDATPPRRARLSASLARNVPVDGAELAQRLRALAKGATDGPLAIPASDLALARHWIGNLLERMDTLSNLTDQELADLAALKHTAATATRLAVASRAKLGRTSLVAASAMYWLSFGPGKIASNAVAASLIASGLPQAAAFAPWTNVLLVPVIQVLFAEPVGGAYRADGQSYASPDGVAYVNYQTAHALMIRAWIEGQQGDMRKYQKIMGEIVDGVIEREGKLDDAGHPRMSLVSGASKPERDEHGIARVAATDPAGMVMSHARWRAFLADEVPVHTFTLLNGISGGVSLLWPGLVGAAWAKLPDAALHVLLGTVAMVWMFEGQNNLRRDLQAASVAHGSDKDILALKRAEPEQRQQLWETRKSQAKSALAELRSLRESLRALIQRSAPGDPNRAQAREQLDLLDRTVRELELRLSDIRKARGRAERATQAWASSRHRAETAVTRTLSSYSGEHDKQPVKWLDGSPVVVRNISRLFGYMGVLSPSAAQNMLLSLMLSADAPAHGPEWPAWSNSTVPQPMGWNTTHLSGNTTDPAHPASVNVAAFAMASTVALTAIVGWTGRSLYAVPAFEHLLHGVIGVANRIGSTASALCGVVRPAGVAADLVVELPGERERPAGSPDRGASPASSASSSSSSSAD